jgi:signal transduction histidine kinase
VRVRAATCGRHSVLVVEDNGVGIAADQLERVFAPLYTTKPRGVGTGLGLGVVRRIVESHGGRVDLASQPGQGTAFSIRLPSADVVAVAAVAPARPLREERARPVDQLAGAA